MAKANTAQAGKYICLCSGANEEFFCMECEQYFCLTCRISHMKANVSKTHQLVDFLQTVSEDCDICLNKNVGQYYCLDCSQYFCSSCKACHLRATVSKMHTLKVALETGCQDCEVCLAKNAGQNFCIECSQYFCSNCKTIHLRATVSKNHDFRASSNLKAGKLYEVLCQIAKTGNTKTDRTFNTPDYWEIMDDTVIYKAVILNTSTHEYNEVSRKFQISVGKPRKIVQIQRIQNKTLYQQYVAKKKMIDSMNPPGHQNEKSLWHGTSKDAIESINKFGFNRSYCARFATAFGHGTYFSKDASYAAHDTYSTPDTKGNKRIYLCKVLTGEYTNGQCGMDVPPTKMGTHIIYDSVVNDASNPTVFKIFHDAQAYPEYTINFK